MDSVENIIDNEKIEEEMVISETVEQEYMKLNCSDIKKDTYFISDNGVVVTIKAIDIGLNGSAPKIVNGLIEEPIRKDTKGYYFVSLLSESGKKKRYMIHRLLAEIFIVKTKSDKKNNRNIVHIKDGDKSNVSLSNLMWVNNKDLGIRQSLRTVDICCINELEPYIVKMIKDGYTNADIKKIIDIKIKNMDFYLIKYRLFINKYTIEENK